MKWPIVISAAHQLHSDCAALARSVPYPSPFADTCLIAPITRQTHLPDAMWQRAQLQQRIAASKPRSNARAVLESRARELVNLIFSGEL